MAKELSPFGRIYRLYEEGTYTIDRLRDLLCPIGEDELWSLIADMRDAEICKKNRDGTFKFPYVGLVEFRARNREKVRNAMHDKRIVFVPKFFEKDERSCKEQEGLGCCQEALTEAQKIVLQAVFKYRKEKNAMLFASGQMPLDEGVSSRLSIYIALIADAMEHGPYLVERRLLVENGLGEIDWPATIATQTPLWHNRRPYYLKHWTAGVGYDESHFITLLHAQLLRTCFKEIDEWGLASVLGLDIDGIEDADEFDWSKSEYYLAKISDEMKVQFVTQKQYTLKLMRAVIEDVWNEGEVSQDLQYFGMTGVHELWERAIKDVLRDEINKKPEDTNVKLKCDPGDEGENNKAGRSILEYIDPPIWENDNSRASGSSFDESGNRKADRLEPDFVATYQYDNASHFVILDAKYYCPKFEGDRISGQPGVGDVNKQLLYQLAYRKLIAYNNKQGQLFVHNAFVMPKPFKDSAATNAGSAPGLSLSPTSFAKVYVGIFAGVMPCELSVLYVDGVRLFDYYVRGIIDDNEHLMLSELVGIISRTAQCRDDGCNAEGANAAKE